MSNRGSSMGSGFSARTIRIGGSVSIVRSCSSILTRRRSPGRINWADEMFGYVVGGEAEDMERDFRDDAWGMPKAVVIDDAFDWGDDQPAANAAAQHR